MTVGLREFVDLLRCESLSQLGLFGKSTHLPSGFSEGSSGRLVVCCLQMKTPT